MIYSSKNLSQLLVELCVQHQIEHIVISPGSRNAPLTIGFSNHPKMKAYSVVDERCAAFFALGISQQTQQPTVLVCTSGSALLNYYPAIAEAFYSQIPLIIISADRPKNLIDIGDGQTIRQENVFDNHIYYNANLSETSLKNQKHIEEAIITSKMKKGPVHINAPFSEPLYEICQTLKIKLEENKVDSAVSPSYDIEKFRSIWGKAEKILIVVGLGNPDLELQEVLTQLIVNPAVLILTETTSNVYHPQFVGSIDRLINSLTHEELVDLRPDLLITLGGMIISKKIKNFLRNHQPSDHWHIDPTRAFDTYHCLTHHIAVRPLVFFNSITTDSSIIKSDFQRKWKNLDDVRSSRHRKYLNSAVHSDLKAMEVLLSKIPEEYCLQLGNSAVVRYMQLFDNQQHQTNCNRGTSGIDGSTSTAIGAALINETPTLLISGDLSFFYDSNALWNNYIKTNFRIVIINNSGGGIFKILPGPSNTNALPYFTTPHTLTAMQLCEMYKIDYHKASTTEDVKGELVTFFNATQKPKLLEIFTPYDINDQVLKKYFEKIA